MDPVWLDVVFRRGPGSLIPEPGMAWSLAFRAQGFCLVADPRRRWSRKAHGTVVSVGTWDDLRYVAVDAEPVDSRPVLHLGLDAGDLALLVEPLRWDLLLTLRHAFRNWPTANEKLLRTDWTAPRGTAAPALSATFSPAT